MTMSFELRVELEPIAPETMTSAKSQLHTALLKALKASTLTDHAVETPRIAFEQYLPLTKEEVETTAIVLQFVIEKGPEAWRILRTFIAQLAPRLATTSSKTVEFTLTVNGKQVKAKGLSLEDTVKVVMDDYAAELGPDARE